MWLAFFIGENKMGVVSSAAAGFDKAETAIEATTAGGTSGWIQLPQDMTLTFFCETLGAGETVQVQIQAPDGTGIDVTSGSLPVQLTDSSNTEAIYAKGVYRFVLSATASATGVYYFAKNFRKD